MNLLNELENILLFTAPKGAMREVKEHEYDKHLAPSEL